MKYGCRAHDLGRYPAAELARRLRQSGCNAAQLTLPKAIAGIDGYDDIRPDQLEAVRTAFAEVEISVMGCYQDLSCADEDQRRRAVDTVCRALGCGKAVGAKSVGSESACRDLTHEEKLAAIPRLTDSVLRIVERAAALDMVFAIEPVFHHVFYGPEVLDHLLNTVADPVHLKVIFDPVNLFTTKDAQNAAFQAEHWKSWLAVIGKQLGAMHCKDCRIEPDGSKTLVGLGKGQMDYAPILDWLAQYAPETPLIRDEVILECAPADIKILHQMQQSIEEKRMK